MNRAALVRKLDELGVPRGAYHLNGGVSFQGNTLEERPDGWAVYLSERGSRLFLVLFGTEEEACENLLARVSMDHVNPEHAD